MLEWITMFPLWGHTFKETKKKKKLYSITDISSNLTSMNISLYEYKYIL